VIEVKSSLCLIVSLPLLQRSVAVEVDRDCVDIAVQHGTLTFQFTRQCKASMP
jgi:hypothetical protein